MRYFFSLIEMSVFNRDEFCFFNAIYFVSASIEKLIILFLVSSYKTWLFWPKLRRSANLKTGDMSEPFFSLLVLLKVLRT
jgi:hypothetical protein